MRSGGLFAGYGGLDMAVAGVGGVSAATVGGFASDTDALLQQQECGGVESAEARGERRGEGSGGRSADRGRGVVAWGQYEPAIRRWEHILGRVAPAPTELSSKGTQRLSPRFVEFLMGLPAGHVTAVPGVNRNAQLKALGNGVVPQQAIVALRHMYAAERREVA